MSRPVFARPIMLMALVPFLFASQASAQLIPWTYNSVFGYGSPWTGGYGYPGYGVGYAPDYMAGQTYTAGYTPYYAGYGSASACGCSPCQNSCSPCGGCNSCSGGGCTSGDCGTSNYAPAATDRPTPTAPANPNAGETEKPSGTQTFRKKELPADEFEPVVPGSEFRSAPPSERDSTAIPKRDQWNGVRGTTDAPPATFSPVVPAESPAADEVVPGNMIRPAPAEPRNDFFNETNEVIPSGTSETRSIPQRQVAGTSFMPPRQRLQLHAHYVQPAVTRPNVPTEAPATVASVARK